MKKVNDWNFSSGALVVCLVAYSDGTDVQSFQLVQIFLISYIYWLLTQILVSKVRL